MQIAILILIFILLLGALAWHGGRDLWTRRSSPKSKLYYAMAAGLGGIMLVSSEMASSPEILTGPILIMVVVVMSGVSRRYREYRQQDQV